MGGGRRGRLFALALLLPVTAGCSLGPKAFRPKDLMDPAPLVRARAVTMGDQMPSQLVVPALLDRLDDPDPVVRLTANEELKKRTGQDFGYRPWDDKAERSRAITRWRTWWSGRTMRPVRPSPQQRPIKQARLQVRGRWWRRYDEPGLTVVPQP